MTDGISFSQSMRATEGPTTRTASRTKDDPAFAGICIDPIDLRGLAGIEGGDAGDVAVRVEDIAVVEEIGTGSTAFLRIESTPNEFVATEVILRIIPPLDRHVVSRRRKRAASLTSLHMFRESN